MNDQITPELALELAIALAARDPKVILFQTEPCGHCSNLVVWVASAPEPYWYCSTCDCRWTPEGNVWARADICDNGETIEGEE